MEFNNQNNNIMMPNQMNNLLYNGMMMNGVMQNQMNYPVYNGMMQNPMNNMIYGGIMQNQMYYPIYNGMMQNPMNNLMFTGMIQNQINNQINNQGFPVMNDEMNGNQINNINLNNNMGNTENIPIENSIKLENDNNELIKYYLYPEIEFTEDESKNAKVLLVIGQTGHGKTTFINALVNIYLGISFNDKFRYLLVRNENKNQLNSITKQITIYKIRPKKELNFPPLIIIDTPGFGDTGGDKEDKVNLKKFKEFFDSKKINNVNCILYIIIGANSRFGENDKNIINYLLNLFSKNVKENFVVVATNFIPENKKDIPNIIKSLSDENHFYYQNVLKNDQLSREQILNSYWYFASDNKIISNNEIEGNSKEKEKWDYTENQIKNFIYKKLITLEKKDIEDSKKVLNNRFQLENEIKCFTEKIDFLIPKKLAFEYNIQEQKNCKELIEKIKDKISKNKIEKDNIVQTLKEINNTLPFMKRKIYKQLLVKNDRENLVCEKCEFNCHKNCNCNLTLFSNWFCNMIYFNGKCKICNHDVSLHKKGKFIYIQDEENEPLINDNLQELKNYVKFLSSKKEDNKFNLKALIEDNDILKKALNQCNEQINKCNEEIENYKNQSSSVEKDIINALKNIKNILDYLRKNALNKEKRTINIFIEEYAKNKNDKEKKILENLYQQFLILDNNDIFPLKIEE